MRELKIVTRNDYYLFNGDFTGSWNGLPGDIIVVCWNASTRDETLAHFDSLGLRTIAAVYFDTGSLDDTQQWLTSLRHTQGACGAMYTTWRSDYRLLEPFVQLLQSPSQEDDL